MQERRCLTCNTVFEVPASSKRQYCSPGCWPPQTHSRKPRQEIALSCDHCGAEFRRKAWYVKKMAAKGWGQYCSVVCRDAVKRGRKGSERVERITLTCERCDKVFQVAPWEAKGRRFCSKACAGASNLGQPPRYERSYVNGDGYVFVFVPKGERPPGLEHLARHPEHRVVMARTLGRWPAKHESVHHINGDKSDNRPENLQLRSGSHGKGRVLRCRCCGSSDIEAIELN